MPEWLHPYRAARVVADGMTVGWFGQLHPREAGGAQVEGASAGGRALSRPAVQAAVAPAEASGKFRASSPFAAIFLLFWTRASRGRRSIEAVAGLQIPELVEWRVREVFRDAKRGAGEYSLLLGTTFQAPDRTLREEELQSFQAQVVEAVGKVGARLRS